MRVSTMDEFCRVRCCLCIIVLLVLWFPFKFLFSRMLFQNDYLKIIELPHSSLPAIREFANVLVKADIRGI